MDLFLFYLWCIWLCRVSCAEKDDGDTKRTYKTDSGERSDYVWLWYDYGNNQHPVK